MKRCPKCAYDNADQAEECEICRGSLAGIVPVAIPVSRQEKSRQARSFMLSGILLLACGLFFFRAPAPAPESASGLSPDGGFTYEGVLHPLEKMKRLRFLPLEDRRGVAELLYSPEEKVGFAAAQLLGVWARGPASPEERRIFFEALLKAAAESRGAARSQAALEAGLCAGSGFPFAPYSPQLRKAAAGLMKEKDERLNAAGFFLASMGGFSDLVPELDNILAAAPSPYLKLYAACALSRLGGLSGHKHLLSVASSGSELGGEAISCLSFSVSPDAGPFLEKAAAGKMGTRSAAPAKIALTLRKQLAIINR